MLLMESSAQTKEKKMLAKYLSNCGSITKRGQSVSDAIDAFFIYGLIFLAFGVAGSIETGRWF